MAEERREPGHPQINGLDLAFSFVKVVFWLDSNRQFLRQSSLVTVRLDRDGVGHDLELQPASEHIQGARVIPKMAL